MEGGREEKEDVRNFLNDMVLKLTDPQGLFTILAFASIERCFHRAS
jgi:hypothetical protein